MSEDYFDFLSTAESGIIAAALEGEGPRAVAIVLSHLSSAKAAAVLALMPDTAAGIIENFCLLGMVPAAEIRELAGRVKGGIPDGEAVGLGGIEQAAEILGNIPDYMSKTILEKISSGDQELADELRLSIFQFTKLLSISDDGLFAVIKQVSLRDLAIAVKGEPEAWRGKFMARLPQKARKRLEEKIASIGTVALAAVDEARGRIEQTARELIIEGVMILSEGGDPV